MEGVEQGVGVREVACDRQRASGHDDRDDGFSAAAGRGDQFALRPLQVEVGQAVGFAREDGLFTDEEQYGVVRGGLGREGGQFGGRNLFAAVCGYGVVPDVQPVAVGCTDGGQRGDRVVGLAVEGPGAQLLGRGVGHRAGDQYAAQCRGVERQDAALVAEQDGRLLGRAAGCLEVFGSVGHPGDAGGVDIGVFEESEAELHAQDVAHGLIEPPLVHRTFIDQILEVEREDMRHHVHVHAGVDRLHGSILRVGGESVRDHLAGRVPVRYDHSVESPLVAEHLFEQEAVARRGNAVVVVERGHQGHGAVADGLFEGRQVDVAQLPFGQVGRIVVPAALAGSVAHEVLGACGDGGRVVRTFALISSYHGGSHGRGQTGILACRFGDAAPARVARDVEHRREGPADAGGRSLDGCDAGPLFDQCGVERCGLSERNGKDGAESVDHVAGDQKRNAQTTLFDGGPLQGVDVGGIDDVEQGADLPVADLFAELFGRSVDGELVRLPDFLLDGHAGDEFVDTLFDLRIGRVPPVGIRLAGGENQDAAQ